MSYTSSVPFTQVMTPLNRVRDNKTSRRQIDRHFSNSSANIRLVIVRTACGIVALLVCELHRRSWFQRDQLTVAVALRDYPDDYFVAVSYVLGWIVVVMEMAQDDCAGGAGGGLLKRQSFMEGMEGMEEIEGIGIISGLSDIPVRSSLRDIHPLHQGHRDLHCWHTEEDGSGRCFG